MQVAEILSKRFVEDWPSHQIIYEWEDVLAAELRVPIADAHPLRRKLFINRYTKQLADLLGAQAFAHLNNAVERLLAGRRGARSLAFELYVSPEPSFTTSPRAVPVLIDFWKRTQTELATFYHTYRDCPLLLVSSLEALQYLQDNRCPLRLAHFPLSLPDACRLAPESRYPKTYDILFAGRYNPVLMGFMQEFVAKYPDTEYLQQQEQNGELYYVSNRRGVVGRFHARPEYMALLRASKVSFYSTPGIDGGEARTNGFNPVTPRYLELLSAQCLLLGRYPQNAETEFYEVPQVCPHIETYAEFESTLLGYLQQEHPSFDRHRAILEKHYTSKRAPLLTEILAQAD